MEPEEINEIIYDLISEQSNRQKKVIANMKWGSIVLEPIILEPDSLCPLAVFNVVYNIDNGVTNIDEVCDELKLILKNYYKL